LFYKYIKRYGSAMCLDSKAAYICLFLDKSFMAAMRGSRKPSPSGANLA
jgi:hypothetical protein